MSVCLITRVSSQARDVWRRTKLCRGSFTVRLVRRLNVVRRHGAALHIPAPISDDKDDTVGDTGCSSRTSFADCFVSRIGTQPGVVFDARVRGPCSRAPVHHTRVHGRRHGP